MNFRIGIGYDIHRLVEGRDLFLAGVKIPFDKGLLGHSDADVALHALCDSLLGAAGLQDIGYYFPPSDEKYRNISSSLLLEEVYSLLNDKGWTIGNVDLVIVAEAPKISPFINEMKSKIAGILKILPEQVGIKATTNEGVGEIGQGIAICSKAVSLIYKKS